jgi:hypothetical protein
MKKDRVQKVFPRSSPLETKDYWVQSQAEKGNAERALGFSELSKKLDEITQGEIETGS